MKKIFIPFTLLILVASCKKENNVPPAPPTSMVHLDSGLLAYFPFNGNINDASQNHNNATSLGGNLDYDEHGYQSSAFNMTGNPSRIIVNNNGSIMFDTAFSVSLHVMIRSIGRQNFFSIVNNETGKGPSFNIGTNVPGSRNLNFALANTFTGCDGYGANTSTFNTSQLEIQPESWYNIVCTFNNGNLKTYVNGDLISSATSSDPKANLCINSQLIIGGWWNGDPTSLNGKIDEVRLYNRTINSDEIAELSKYFEKE